MNNERRTPREFDWVTARSECSLLKIFETLCLQLGQDVETRNLKRGERPFYKFDTARIPTAITVFLDTPMVTGEAVRFSLTEHDITVTDSLGEVMFRAVPTLSGNDGGCRVKVNDQELELWQIRRMALEDLFFVKVKAQ